jgi:hypothetical protein
MSTKDVDPQKLLVELEREEAEVLKQKLIDHVNLLLKEKYVDRVAIAFISDLVK